MSHIDSFVQIIRSKNYVAATEYFDNTVLPDEQNYGSDQIAFASSFRDEAYSNATTVETISAKVSFLNILISFIILSIIIISILYLVMLIFNFLKELKWSGIAGDNVTIVSERD